MHYPMPPGTGPEEVVLKLLSIESAIRAGLHPIRCAEQWADEGRQQERQRASARAKLRFGARVTVLRA